MRSGKIENYEQVFDELVNSVGESVDFDLPPSFSKSQFADYTPIKRNVYLTKKRVEDDGIFCSCTTSADSSTSCNGDCHCAMLFSCCSSGCECGGKCANKPFQNRPVKKMIVVQTEKCGRGLVAEEEIKQGEFVIEYVGEVIDDKTCEERLWKMKRRRNTNFYLCEVNSNMVIDATNRGNRSRFINHCCEPNTEMQKWRIDRETRVGIFALRDISIGEEVTYDYKFVQFGASQHCFCGSQSCKHILGGQGYTPGISRDDPVPTKKCLTSSEGQPVVKRKRHFESCIGEILRVWDREVKMYVPGFIYDYDPHSRMHTVMYHDLTKQKLDLSQEDWDYLPSPEDEVGVFRRFN